MRWTFGFILAAICVFSAPAICFMWIILIGVLDWHDCLLVSCVVAVQFQVFIIRRDDRAADRAMRRVLARRHERREGWTVPAQDRTEEFSANA